MNDQERLELAEVLAPMSDDERVAFLESLPSMPEAEELANIQALINDINASTEEDDEVVEEVDA